MEQLANRFRAWGKIAKTNWSFYSPERRKSRGGYDGFLIEKSFWKTYHTDLCIEHLLLLGETESGHFVSLEQIRELVRTTRVEDISRLERPIDYHNDHVRFFVLIDQRQRKFLVAMYYPFKPFYYEWVIESIEIPDPIYQSLKPLEIYA